MTIYIGYLVWSKSLNNIFTGPGNCGWYGQNTSIVSLTDTLIYTEANSVLMCELDLLVAWPEYQDSFSLTDMH